ncbi:uncharacterized protein PB18E9.04c [Denticeps clupeoides]|uniref:uncharacterized protein PB18E9.04c n=1 Tax=Denticeps clupeoides TaxID=299321 RepID=UPI0010A429A3|nr:mucin-1 [Denticeps clupeoides]
MTQDASKFGISLFFLILTLAVAGYADVGLESNAIITTSPPLSAYYLTIKITNRIYNDSLQDHNSEDYKRLRNEVETLIRNVYITSSDAIYLETRNMGFSNGSVIANSTILFQNNDLDAPLVGNIFKDFSNSSVLDIDKNDILAQSAPLPDLPVKNTSEPTKKPFTSDSATTGTGTMLEHTTRYSSTPPVSLDAVSTTQHSSPTTTSHSTDASPESPITSTSTLPHSSANNHREISSTPSEEKIHPTDHPESASPETPMTSWTSSVTTSTLPTGQTQHPTSSTQSTPAPMTALAGTSVSTESSRNTVHSSTGDSNNTPWPGSSGARTTHTGASTNSISTSKSAHPVLTEMSEHSDVPHHAHSPSATTASSAGVPGWGIALLVLAAIILFILLIILIIILILLVFWCCRGGLVNASDPNPYRQGYYNPDIPLYSTQSTINLPNGTYSEDSPKKGRTGMYVVNE